MVNVIDFIRFEVFTRNSLPCGFICTVFNKLSEEYIAILLFLKKYIVLFFTKCKGRLFIQENLIVKSMVQIVFRNHT